MKLTTKFNRKALEVLENKLRGASFVPVKDAKIMGDDVVKNMRAMIQKGISPIESFGRFPAYKHQGVKGKYPHSARAKYPGKRDRPVNLTLSGKFLEDLRFRITGAANKRNPEIEIGFFKGSEIKKEIAHRQGHNGQPVRPVIPVGDEQLARSLRQIITKHMKAALARFK